MNTTLDQNQPKLAILILPVPIQMLTNLHRLLDQHVQILGDLRGESTRFQDAHDLLSSDGFDLCDAVRVTQNNSDLGWSESLLGEFAHVFFYVEGRDFEPGRWGAVVGSADLEIPFPGACSRPIFAVGGGGEEEDRAQGSKCI
eukprot:CAMPEP_0195514158 /NCGR_PEP_ID=MMETSP0794_2-20130614/5625_1 /TAXON_ID=515487 /ORGANISM="Stephanopyxis turris, Strain CCMP 815" /LENGTH=142 /DNA_ID=CAMNT_0040642337 /DNA_START=136 /DNA_END=565 /DNA_ORIENTATION=-